MIDGSLDTGVRASNSQSCRRVEPLIDCRVGARKSNFFREVKIEFFR
jgi:hypothetical protein